MTEIDNQPNVDSIDIAGLAGMLRAQQLSFTTDDLIVSHSDVAAGLEKCDRFASVSSIASLLLDTRLQRNCLRLESLQHMAMEVCSGTSTPTQAMLSRWLNALGKESIGRLEDPIDDFHVTPVVFKNRCFRVLSGNWESGIFYLQRVLDVLETLPDESSFNALQRSVIAMLILSERACQRAQLARYAIGNSRSATTISRGMCSAASAAYALFTPQDLHDLGVRSQDLAMFFFTQGQKSTNRSTVVTESTLHTHPIVPHDSDLLLALPTAVSYAIREAVRQFMESNGLARAMNKGLAYAYSQLFHSTKLLGSFPGPILKFAGQGVLTSSIIAAADVGRYIHFLFFLDPLSNSAGDDEQVATQLGNVFEDAAARAFALTSKNADFLSGTTLLIHCGLGRGLVAPIPDKPNSAWRVEFLAAPDVYTLSVLHKFNAQKLLRALDSIDALSSLEFGIYNANGLPDLIAWISYNQGHVVQHSQVPSQARKSRGKMYLPTDIALELRKEAFSIPDVHGVVDPHGEMLTVRRYCASQFSEDNALPVYVSDKFTETAGLPFFALIDGRSWWCEVVPNKAHGDYDRWSMLLGWIPRIASVLSQHRIGEKLTETLLVRVSFHSQVQPVPEMVTAREDADASILATIDIQKKFINLSIGPNFYQALSHPSNTAERALVSSLCNAFATLAGEELDRTELVKLENAIVPNDDARYIHIFNSVAFRDCIPSDTKNSLIFIDDQDYADIRSGLAFRTESRVAGRTSIKTKRTCTTFLNKLVASLEDEICRDLRRFEKRAFIESALLNHELAAKERDLWHRTARANLALHEDKSEAIATIVSHSNSVTEILHACRIAVEMANCECSLTDGHSPGAIDFSRILAKVNVIWQLGGWSDGIHLDAMRPLLKITPLGDVQADTHFESSVLRPFADLGNRDLVQQYVENYESNYEAMDGNGRLWTIDNRFKSAWLNEFGITLEQVFAAIGSIEEDGLERGQLVYAMSKSEIESLLSKILPLDAVYAFNEAFTLCPRDAWRSAPNGFKERDYQPWKFRRQLSLVRRPIVKVDHGHDPVCMISPSLIRESVSYVVQSYYEGAFPLAHQNAKGQGQLFQTCTLLEWYGVRSNQRGTQFCKQVAEALGNLGWEVTNREVQLTEICGQRRVDGFGDLKKYGDVDVLACCRETNRVLIVECKHLQFQKSPGEIAEQLGDYRGKNKPNGKPDDLLKHIKRVEILSQRKQYLGQFLNLESPFCVEGWIVFKHPVPMIHAWRALTPSVQVAVFGDLVVRLQR
jgi:hypothetical protein